MTEKFVPLPKWLWRHPGISLVAKNLLVLLDDHRNNQTGQCNPKIKTLAQELAVSISTAKRSLSELVEHGLVRIVWGQRSSHYHPAPRSQWQKILKGQIDPTGKRSEGSKRANTKGQIDPSEGSASLYELDPLNYTQPASQPVKGKKRPPKAGRLAEIAAILTNAWPKLVGVPGKKLLERIAGILGDVPLDEFRGLLESKRRKVESFGLAEFLAADLITRRNGAAAATQARTEADRLYRISEMEASIADPATSPEDRTQLKDLIADLKKFAKTKPPRKGAA